MLYFTSFLIKLRKFHLRNFIPTLKSWFILPEGRASVKVLCEILSALLFALQEDQVGVSVKQPQRLLWTFSVMCKLSQQRSIYATRKQKDCLALLRRDLVHFLGAYEADAKLIFI